MSPVSWEDLVGDDATYPEIQEAMNDAANVNAAQRYAPPVTLVTPPQALAPPPEAAASERDLESQLSDARLRTENFAAKMRRVVADRGAHSESAKRMTLEHERIKQAEYELKDAVENKIVRDGAWKHSLLRAEAEVRTEAAAEEKQLQDSINSNITRNSPAWNWMTERLRERHLSEEEIGERIKQRATAIVARIEAGPPPDPIKLDTFEPQAGAKDAYIAEQVRLGATPTEAAAKAAALERR